MRAPVVNTPEHSAAEVRVHIDRLVIDEGLVAGGDAGRLRIALQQELARLLQMPGQSPRPGFSIHAATAPMAGGSGAARSADLAQSVATGVYQAVRGGV